jgi:hypothetical protein
MAFLALIIGAVLIVAAIRNSQNDLFTELGTDIPGFVIWAAAIVAIGMIGLIPALKPVSKGLLVLIVVVLILNNYQALLAGFGGAIKQGQQVGAAAPGSSPTSAASNASSSGSSPSPFDFLQAYVSGGGGDSAATGGGM